MKVLTEWILKMRMSVCQKPFIKISSKEKQTSNKIFTSKKKGAEFITWISRRGNYSPVSGLTETLSVTEWYSLQRYWSTGGWLDYCHLITPSGHKVTTLSCLGKLLESVVNNRLNWGLEKLLCCTISVGTGSTTLLLINWYIWRTVTSKEHTRLLYYLEKLSDKTWRYNVLENYMFHSSEVVFPNLSPPFSVT